MINPWDDAADPRSLRDDDPLLNRTDKELDHPLEKAFLDPAFKEMFKDRWWRLNHLYFIIDKFGKRILFQPNSDQTKLYDNMHDQNLILKARQRGFTTFIDIYILDSIVFQDDVEAGIIAHNREDVSKIFRRKIIYPYENLPEQIKSFRYPKAKSKTELELNNNSIVSVGTSMRSGTLQLLHVSEFGKVCARYPEKAREIVTGAFEAIHTQTGESIIWVESTAEGRAGYFFDYCQVAQKLDQIGRKPTPQEFKFHFFPWWDNSDNVQQEPVPISREMAEYLDDVESKIGRTLTPEQRNWYVTRHNRLGDDMKRENPATPEEAFESAVKGAYFQNQFVKIRKEKRICSVPYQTGISVRTWWDLGMNDVMAIWFTQDVGREVHVIDYYENAGEGFEHYKTILDGKGYIYGSHHAPHDISVRELGANGRSRWESAARIGLHFIRIPRVKAKMDSINAARRFMAICWFDEERCDKGITRLEGYRKDWNENLQTYRDRPLHDINSNGADAFQTLAMGHDFHVAMGAAIEIKQQSSGGWT